MHGHASIDDPVGYIFYATETSSLFDFDMPNTLHDMLDDEVNCLKYVTVNLNLKLTKPYTY